MTAGRVRLGGIEITPLLDGYFRLDGGAMHGSIPRVLWERQNPADAQHRIQMALRGLLVRTPRHIVVIEPGLGRTHDGRFAERFEVDQTVDLHDGLRQAGITPEQVDIVIDTHLHWDHAGGNVVADDRGVRPTFPNATYVVQKSNWDEAANPHERNRASYRAPDFEVIRAAGQLRLIDSDRRQEVEVVEGVRVERVDGHAVGLQIVHIDGGGQRLCFLTDLAPMAAHLDLPWIMGYDLFPMQTLAEKKRLLPRAVAEDWIVAFVHDPRHVFGRVRLDARGRPTLAPLNDLESGSER